MKAKWRKKHNLDENIMFENLNEIIFNYKNEEAISNIMFCVEIWEKILKQYKED